MRTIKAAVARQKGGPFTFETLSLDDPRADEVIVRIVATGMCHSDIVVVDQIYPLPLPWVLGHEGAGIVERIGSGVTNLVPGDHVVLSFCSCGHCPACDADHSAYCKDFAGLNMSGHRLDGSSTFDTVTDVKGCFFYQSSFATYALTHSRNTVKVRSDAPLALLGPLGCGVQTGAGAVLNVLKPSAGTSFCLFGAGAVGLSALMAAKILGCHPIVAVDRVVSRLAIATDLGATHTIDATREDVLKCLEELGGMDITFDATGVPEVALTAIRALRDLGVCAVVGAYPPGHMIPIDLGMLANGKIVRHIVEGDADAQAFIPQLIDYFMSGQLPIDRMVEFYAFDQINEAMEDSRSGKTIKPIIRISGY